MLVNKGKNKVVPIDLDQDTHLEYFDLKQEYKHWINKLLAIRLGFSQKLLKDALPSITTQNDEISVKEFEQSFFQTVKTKGSKRWIDLRRDYIPKLLTIFLITIFFGGTVAFIVSFTKFFDEFGFFLLWSRGFSVAILFTISFCMFFISHDLMTLTRRRWKNLVAGWLDHYFMIHKFCGYLL